MPAIDAANGCEELDREGTFSAPETAACDPTASILSGIHAIDEFTYTITRSARDAMFSDDELLLRQVRMVPHQEQGVTQGLRVFGIRRTSVVAALGLRNGDTLVSINDVPLGDPERVVEALGRLRRAASASVLIQRRGLSQTLSYRVGDTTDDAGTQRR